MEMELVVTLKNQLIDKTISIEKTNVKTMKSESIFQQIYSVI